MGCRGRAQPSIPGWRFLFIFFTGCRQRGRRALLPSQPEAQGAGRLRRSFSLQLGQKSTLICPSPSVLLSANGGCFLSTLMCPHLAKHSGEVSYHPFFIPRPLGEGG